MKSDLPILEAVCADLYTVSFQKKFIATVHEMNYFTRQFHEGQTG